MVEVNIIGQCNFQQALSGFHLFKGDGLQSFLLKFEFYSVHLVLLIDDLVPAVFIACTAARAQ